MSVWPITLPAYPLTEGFREKMPENILRTDMEQGPAKLRRRTTAGVRGMEMSYLMSKAQVSALETFYNSTLAGGVFDFSYTHPRSGATLDCRFVKPPQYTAQDADLFKVDIVLEVLP